MPTTRASGSRQFKVQKDNGDFFDMNFTKAGVNWTRSDTGFTAPVPGQPFQMPGGGGAGYVRAITAVIDTATNVGMWWETRQKRLMDEAINDETRRIPWLGDMMARWGEAHSDGDRLDLRVSEYLARETREMIDSIIANKRVSLPQSMLYELENIQDTFRSFRSLILAQFETLTGDRNIDLDGAVRSALPNCRLDMDFVRSLGRDPAVDWAERVRSKTTAEFDRKLTTDLSDPSAFLARVFALTEQAAAEHPETARPPGVVERLVGLIGPALPKILALDSRPDASERRDAFRELSLLPAEVARVRALNSAWLATSAIVASATGNEVLVQLSGKGVGLELAPLEAPRALLA
jgi:hypothetical protein